MRHTFSPAALVGFVEQVSEALTTLPELFAVAPAEAHALAVSLTDAADIGDVAALKSAFSRLAETLRAEDALDAWPPPRQLATFQLLQHATHVLQELLTGGDSDEPTESELALAEATAALADYAVEEEPAADDTPVPLPGLSHTPRPKPPPIVDPPAEPTVDPLWAVFREEAAEHLAVMQTMLGDLSDSPENFAALGELRRATHTLKGAAGAVRQESVLRLAHRMEDLLDMVVDRAAIPDAATVGLWQRTTDLIEEFVDQTNADSDTRKEEMHALLAEYDVHDMQDGQSVPLAEPNEVEAPDAESSAAEYASRLAEVVRSAAVAGASAGRPTPVESAPSAPLVRVPLDHIEAVAHEVGDLSTSRLQVGHRLNRLGDLLEELDSTLERVRRVATDLEFDGDGRAGGGPNPETFLTSGGEEFDELEFDRYTEFHLLVRTLTEAASDLSEIGGGLGGLLDELSGLTGTQQRLTKSVHGRLLRMRMVPLASASAKFRRIARTAADRLGKSIDFRLSGDSVTLDKSVLEALMEPLSHLLRNAIAHGIESPDERVRLGKERTGTVSLTARSVGTWVELVVTDDGGGIRWETFAEPDSDLDIHSLDATARLDLLCTPGLSTASEVDEISGRGIGMDAARTAVVRLGGALSLDESADVGTQFIIRVPTTLATMRALLVSAGGHRFALPLDSVREVRRLAVLPRMRDGEWVVDLDEGARPFVSLVELLGLPESESSQVGFVALIDNDAGGMTAVGVDALHPGRDVLVKPLERLLAGRPGFIGATLPGDGSVVLILSLSQILTSGVPTLSRSMEPIPLTRPRSGPRRLLVVDDSVSVRKVTGHLLERAGYEVSTARDGLDALEVLDTLDGPPDAVLLDVEMPRMDGYELLGRLRNDPETRDVPVIMITSRGAEKHRKRAALLGASDYLVKPYQEDELLARLEVWWPS